MKHVIRTLVFLCLLAGFSSVTFAQGVSMPFVKAQFSDSLGRPLAFGKLWTYASGTTTPLSTWSDSGLTALNANPIILDAAGRPPTGIFLIANRAYSFTMQNALNVLQWTQSGINDRASLIYASLVTLLDDNVAHCSQDAGATAGDKIIACIARLPSTGGTADVRGMEGAQSWPACPFTGLTKPVTVLLGSAVPALDLDCTVPASVTLDFSEGAILSIASTKTLTFAGGLKASLSAHFTGAGSVAITSTKIPTVYPQWWGALGDNAHDDTTAIQSAIDAARGPWNGAFAYIATSQVFLLPGTYKVTNQLNMYKATPSPGGYEYSSLVGSGAGNTVIRYSGASNKSAIRMIGAHVRIANIEIDDYGTGWVSGIDYDGDSAIGRSTSGHIQNVVIGCNSLPGDGVGLGRALYQADMLNLDHPYINGCTTGNGIATFNGNVLAINVFAATVFNCHIGVFVGTSSNLNVFGGEFDQNDINFSGLSHGPVIYDGIRSEGSKRTFWSGVSTTTQAVTLRNYYLSSINAVRPATTGAATTNLLTLSVTGFISGDSVVIAGAGVAGVDLHTKIGQLWSGNTVYVISPAVSTAVTVAAVTLDATVEQHNLEENSGGPYTHIDNFFVPAAGTTAQQANGPQIFIGNAWTQNTTNPFGMTTTTGATGRTTTIGNRYNATTRMTDRLEPVNAVTLTANSATPDLLALGGNGVFVTANSVDTNYTDFLNGYYGQRISIRVNDTHTFFAKDGSEHIRGTGPTAGPVKAVAESVYAFENVSGAWFLQGSIPYLTGLSAAIGGGALAAGACATDTVTIAGADKDFTGNGVVVTPLTNPGATIYWKGLVTAANTVTVYVCSATGSTPSSTTYNVRILQ